MKRRPVKKKTRLQLSAGLLVSGCVLAYCTWLLWSALTSEPASGCVRLASPAGGSDASQIVGFFLSLAATTIATVQLGMDCRPFELYSAPTSPAAKSPEEGPPPYNTVFFHAIFALASMNLCMLFTGWDLRGTQGIWALGSGWLSTWVKARARTAISNRAMRFVCGLAAPPPFP